MGLSVATRVELGKVTVGVTTDVPLAPSTSATGSVAVGAVVTVPAPAPVVTVPPAPVLTAPVEPVLEVVSSIVDPFEEMLMDWPKPVIGNLPELCGQPAAPERPAPEPAAAADRPAVPDA